MCVCVCVIYQEHLALNNPQRLISHQTKQCIYNASESNGFVVGSELDCLFSNRLKSPGCCG